MAQWVVVVGFPLGVPPLWRPLRNCACRTWFFPPTRPVCLWGTPPRPPAVGHRPSALPHSRSYASRPYELCKGLPALESLMLALRPTPQATKIGGVGRLHHLCGALLSKQATTDTTLHPSAPCALVAHLDASLRWHDGAYTAAPPLRSPRTLILTFSQREKGPCPPRGNDVYEQRSCQRGYDVRAVVVGFWGIRLGWRDLRRFANRSLHPHREQGFEVPAFAGTTGPLGA